MTITKNEASEDTGAKNIFSRFDRIFQEKIIQAMLTDKIWAAQVAEVIDSEFFEYAYLRQISALYLDHYRQWKEFPSLDLFITIIKETFKNHLDAGLKQQIVTVISNTKNSKDIADLEFVKEESLSFCKRQGFKNALLECTEFIDDPLQYDRAIEIVKKAIVAGQAQSPGLSLTDDIDARYSETYRPTIKTNICSRDGSISLDDRNFLNGGTGPGELNTVIASSGVGKSHLLVHIGAQALLQKKNVLHFTFELDERRIGIRYDSHLIGLNSLECASNKDLIKEFYKENQNMLGKLRIKYFTNGSVNVNHLRAFIDKLAMEGFKPDLLVIDYAGIMRSTVNYELPRFELKKIYEDLRALANDIQVSVWTATQSNREGSDSEIITMKMMGESIAMAQPCDLILGLGRPETEKSTGLGTLFIAKNRAGLDGFPFKVRIDTAQSRIVLLDAEETKNYNAEQEKRKKEEGNLLLEKYKTWQKTSKPITSKAPVNNSVLFEHLE